MKKLKLGQKKSRQNQKMFWKNCGHQKVMRGNHDMKNVIQPMPRLRRTRRKLLSILFTLFIGLAPLIILSQPSTNTKKQENLRYNIQIPVDISELVSIQHELSFIINKIVKKELGLKQNYTFNFFREQQNPHISVYFLGDINAKNKGKDIIYNAITSLFNKKSVFEFNNVMLCSNLDFFGFKKNTLVMMVDDGNSELAHLNQVTKETMNKVNEQYKNENNKNLYNIQKSEEFSYHPHIGFGWISVDAIKDRIKNTKQADEILEKIRQEILKECQLVFDTFLNEQNSKITIDTLSIFDLESRTDIKKYDLGNTTKEIVSEISV